MCRYMSVVCLCILLHAARLNIYLTNVISHFAYACMHIKHARGSKKILERKYPRFANINEKNIGYLTYSGKEYCR